MDTSQVPGPGGNNGESLNLFFLNIQHTTFRYDIYMG